MHRAKLRSHRSCNNSRDLSKDHHSGVCIPYLFRHSGRKVTDRTAAEDHIFAVENDSLPRRDGPLWSMQRNTAWMPLITEAQSVEAVPSPYLEETESRLLFRVSNGEGSARSNAKRLEALVLILYSFPQGMPA